MKSSANYDANKPNDVVYVSGCTFTETVETIALVDGPMINATIMDATPMLSRFGPQDLVEGKAWQWLLQYGFAEGVTSSEGVATITPADHDRILAASAGYDTILRDQAPIFLMGVSSVSANDGAPAADKTFSIDSTLAVFQILTGKNTSDISKYNA